LQDGRIGKDLAFWAAIAEKFDGEDRIDSSARRALSFFFY